MWKQFFNRQRLIVLMITGVCAATLTLLAACADAKTAEASATKTPGLSSGPSPSGSEPTAPEPSTAPPSTQAPSDYSVTWTAENGTGHNLAIGRQNGAYPWDRSFPATGEIRTESSVSGDMPGVVSGKVRGDGFMIWYGHIEETGGDYVSRIQISNPCFKTPAGIGIGSTAETLLAAYPNNLLYQPEPFPVSEDFGGDFCNYDFLLAYSADGISFITFYIQETAEGNIVRGIALLGPTDGSPWYTADQSTTFAVDAALAKKLAKPDISDETAIYGLLGVKDFGAAEKKAILSHLPGLNWKIYDGLYGSQAYDLMTWLYAQTLTGDDDIFNILRSNVGLDGAYAEGYASIIAGIYDREPETLIRQLAKLPNNKLDHTAGLLAYGLSYFDPEPITAELKAMTENSKLSEREQTAARVVLHAVTREK